MFENIKSWHPATVISFGEIPVLDLLGGKGLIHTTKMFRRRIRITTLSSKSLSSDEWMFLHTFTSSGFYC